MKYHARFRWIFFAGLIALTAIYAAGLWVLANRGGIASRTTLGLWELGSRLFLVSWIRADRQIRGLSVPFEFDAFVFWAWPIAIFYYFCKSLRWRGLLLAFGVLCLMSLPEVLWSFVRLSVTPR